MATPGGEVINTKFSHLVLKMCHARVCSEHGLWSGDAPECSPINCGAPLSLDNGVVSLLNDSTHLGSLVAYHCREDFILNTTSDKGEVHHYMNHHTTFTELFVSDIFILSQCSLNGSWTPVDAACVVASSSASSDSLLSDWSIIITITVLSTAIIVLLGLILRFRGFNIAENCLRKKPNIISKGVNAKSIVKYVIENDIVNNSETNKYHTSPLSTFSRYLLIHIIF